MDNLAALARYFNVTLDYLVTGQEPPAPAAQTTIVNNYYQRWRYEYKSQRTLFGLPLVHIRLGTGHRASPKAFWPSELRSGHLHPRRLLPGLVSIGGLSVGLLFSLAGWAIGGIAVGGFAVGLLAIGGAAVGLFAMGGGAFGVYAAGGGAIASEIAIGGSAHAPLAIGRVAEGALTFVPGSDPAQVAEAIRQAASARPASFKIF